MCTNDNVCNRGLKLALKFEESVQKQQQANNTTRLCAVQRTDGRTTNI